MHNLQLNLSANDGFFSSLATKINSGGPSAKSVFFLVALQVSIVHYMLVKITGANFQKELFKKTPHKALSL